MDKRFEIDLKKVHLSKDEMSELLKTDKKLLESFDSFYLEHSIDEEKEGLFGISAKQISKILGSRSNKTTELNDEQKSYLESIKERIVNELVGQTTVYEYDGNVGRKSIGWIIDTDNEQVSKDEILKIDEKFRPQLTGNLIKVDIGEPTYKALLFYYKKYIESNDEKTKRDCYNRFRQGLDILDLDPITYRLLNNNRNSMGNWLPQLVSACENNTFFKIPATRVVKVPLPILQLTRLEYSEINRTTFDIVNEWAMRVFGLDINKKYFIKTGTYSSKFDFRNACIRDPNEVKEIGEYLTFIHNQAVMMCSPLCQPSIYGVSTTNEWVVREFIGDIEGNPTIYKGLPLHTEYRFFVDCDTKELIGYTPYWEPETMKKRFGGCSDADSVHNKHDYVVYQAHEKTLMSRYNDNIIKVGMEIKQLIQNLNLEGQWSIDIMQNGKDFWIIDMAIAENSAFYDKCVLPELRKPSIEDWIKIGN